VVQAPARPGARSPDGCDRRRGPPRVHVGVACSQQKNHLAQCEQRAAPPSVLAQSGTGRSNPKQCAEYQALPKRAGGVAVRAHSPRQCSKRARKLRVEEILKIAQNPKPDPESHQWKTHAEAAGAAMAETQGCCRAPALVYGGFGMRAERQRVSSGPLNTRSPPQWKIHHRHLSRQASSFDQDEEVQAFPSLAPPPPACRRDPRRGLGRPC